MRFLTLFVSICGLLMACGGTAFTGQTDAQGGRSSSGGADGKAGAAMGGSAGEAIAGEADGGEAMGGASNAGAAMGGAATAGTSMGGAATAGSGGAADVPDSTCPKTMPVVGHACLTGLACSYGDDPRPACRAHHTCTNGKWPASPPVAACPSLVDCSMTPSGFPIDGHSCKVFGEECTFDGGGSGTIYCRCNFCGDAMTCPAEMADWVCAGPPASPCPEALPNEGQACEKKQSCFYGVPCEGVTMECNGKTWSAVASGCAN